VPFYIGIGRAVSLRDPGQGHDTDAMAGLSQLDLLAAIHHQGVRIHQPT
jgi:hypothetical protein